MKIIVTEKELVRAKSLIKHIELGKEEIERIINHKPGNIDLPVKKTAKKPGFVGNDDYKRYKNMYSLEKKVTRELKTIYILTINEDLIVDTIDIYAAVILPMMDALKGLAHVYMSTVKGLIDTYKNKWK